MAGKRNEQEISRREFGSRIGAAAAGLAAGSHLLTPEAVGAAPLVSGRVLGANDRLVVASIGIRGQGNSVKRGFAKLKGVEIKTLCDIDENLAAERINDKALAQVATYKPGFVQDLRRVMEDKDIDAVIVATPNHWHALATIWALQAGKHVYVEKPSSHTVWEGRKMVEAADKYKKMVQAGTMNRSRPAVRQAIQFLHKGGIGKVYMARGLCYKPRPGIGKYPDGPMAAGEQVQAECRRQGGRAGLRRRVPLEGELRPVARTGGAASVQSQPLPLQLALALGLRQRRHGQPGSAPVRHRALGSEQERAPGEDLFVGRLLRS